MHSGHAIGDGDGNTQYQKKETIGGPTKTCWIKDGTENIVCNTEDGERRSNQKVTGGGFCQGIIQAGADSPGQAQMSSNNQGLLHAFAKKK